MTNVRCNLTDAEKAEVKEWFDNEYWLDADEEAKLIDYMEAWLFYDPDRNGKARTCICSYPDCSAPFRAYKGTDPELFKKHHGDDTTCPNCGRPVELRALGKCGSFVNINAQRQTRFTLTRLAPDGGLLLLSGYAFRWYAEDDLKPSVEVSWRMKTYLNTGKRGQWIRKPVDQFTPGLYTGWEYKATVSEPFHPRAAMGWQNYDNCGDGYFINFLSVLERSNLRYSQLDDYMMGVFGLRMDGGQPIRGAIKYLAAYTEYPTLEMAVKTEFFRAADDLAQEGLKNHRDLDWRATRLQDFFRLDKQDCNALLKSESANFGTLAAYHEASKANKIKNMAEYLQILSTIGGAKNAGRLTECAETAGMSLQQAANYIKHTKQPSVGTVALQYWADYLMMARKLGYDLTRRDVAAPKNLARAHDEAVETINVNAKLESRKAAAGITKKLKREYAYRANGYRIVVPECPEDIVHEGVTLKHCVKGYAPSHFAGTAVILFLRRDRKPETPFVTIEIKPRRRPSDPVEIVQVHGYRNEGYSPVGGYGSKIMERKWMWWLAPWMAWVQAGSPRDKQGNPIIKKESATA